MRPMLDEYSEEVFHTLPFAKEAFDYVDQNPLTEHMIDALRSVFIRHQQTDTYGIYILHRHFDLDPGELLVEYQNVSTPWRLPKNLPEVCGGVHPKAWSLADEVVRPLEFAYADALHRDKHTPPPPLDFLMDLRETLMEYGLQSRYGLSILPDDALDETKPPKLEFTAGRSNITIPMTDEVSHVLNTQTMFLFPCIDPLLDGDYHGPRMRHCIACPRH